jgi:hypothetical protein
MLDDGGARVNGCDDPVTTLTPVRNDLPHLDGREFRLHAIETAP